ILPGHRNPVFTIESGLEPPVFFTAGNDPGIVKWDLRQMKHEKVLVKVNSSVYALHRPHSHPLLIAGERSGQVSVIDLPEERPVKVLSLHRAPVFDIKTSARNRLIYVASEDGHVSVWSLDDFHHVYTFRVSND